MNPIKRYFKWTGSLSAYKLSVLILLLLILASIWLIYVKG
jgi:hypothetical protein